MRDPLPEEIFPQHEKELESMLAHVRGCRSFLEIGSRFGETLKRIAAVMPEGSRIVSVDIGDDPIISHEFGEDKKPSVFWKKSCDEIGSRHEVHRIQADSQSPETAKKVSELGPFDFCFIDADHETHGVRRDWENYGHLCKIVAFHDIAADSVRQVWNEAKRSRDHREYVHSSMGIGVLRSDGGSL